MPLLRYRKVVILGYRSVGESTRPAGSTARRARRGRGNGALAATRMALWERVGPAEDGTGVVVCTGLQGAGTHEH